MKHLKLYLTDKQHFTNKASSLNVFHLLKYSNKVFVTGQSTLTGLLYIDLTLCSPLIMKFQYIRIPFPSTL